MAKDRYLSESEQKVALELKKTGMSNREIARRIKRSETVIRNLLKKGEKYVVKKKTKGNTKISNRERNQILELARTGRYNATEIKQELRLPITNKRIAQILRGSGQLKYTKKAKKPNLSQAQFRRDWISPKST
ncbi:uncharacterized protein LOC129752442 [Uranotaenia lowii]|uniref:uncharacterized protein LOC129752442 n=1 Tax=Uranotaenia lowii TaxID=190385 RepID=UPI002479492B|nr:uncharacterized protein LOC129752442 [Uranotaenia lowii]